MNSTSTSRIDRFQLVTDDRDPGLMSSEFDRLPSVPPQLETETDYDLMQLCDDLAAIQQGNPRNSQTGLIPTNPVSPKLRTPAPALI